MSQTGDTLAGFAVFRDMDAAHLSTLAKAAADRSFGVDERIIEAEQPADTFYAIRSGRIAIEIETPNRGPLTIETIGPGDILGVSWLLAPYRWAFGARALEPTRVIAIDARELRKTCDDDPGFGYDIYKRFSGIVHRRLVATRLRALDLYRSDAR